MDPIKILQRAWHILWRYRTLWIFGFILALAVGGTTGNSGNNNMQFSGDENDFQYQAPMPEDWQAEIGRFFRQVRLAIDEVLEEGLPALGVSRGELTALLWTGAVFLLLMLVFGMAMAVARYVSETALIRMVDEYETNETQLSVREGFRIGWSRTSWRLFLINLIVNLPAFALVAVLIIAGFSVYSMVTSQGGEIVIAGVVGVIGVAFLTIFLAAILGILLRLLRHFFWRVCALEGASVGESLRRGIELVRANWKNVGLMWLIMVGLGIAWMLVYLILSILVIPVGLVTSLLGLLVVAVPGLLLVGLFSLFLGGYLPWIAGGAFVLPLFFILAFSPWILLTAWQMVYSSTVWTLTYREIKALGERVPGTETATVAD